MSTAHQMAPVSPTVQAAPLKILLWSNAFEPSVGGLEAMAKMLGEEFVRRGHQVTVITRSDAPPSYTGKFSFNVVRRPSWFQLLQLVKACDVYFQNHLSLKAAWPLLILRRPWVVGYQTWISTSGFRGALQQFFIKAAHNISCSQAIANHLRANSVVVPNAYDDITFKETWRGPRDRELMFVGRLIEAKGVEVIFEALRLLKAEGLYPKLTVCGIGPREDALRHLATQMGLDSQVEFVGKKAGKELSDLLNRHQILIAPSVWLEPFGIVALEGIACGCVVVGSDGGGLKDAIGPCGVTFPNGDAAALADRLSRLLRQPSEFPKYRSAAAEHLARHTKSAVADSYLRVIRAAV